MTNTPTHISWPSIEGFHNVRKSVHKYPELLGGSVGVRYAAKVKLHGTNAAVQINSDTGMVVAQSRTSVITPENDNCEFAKWVEETRDCWFKNRFYTGGMFVVFGEWCGKGIQKGVAVSNLPGKIFAVFGALIPATKNTREEFIWQPYKLDKLVEGVPDTYVIPIYESCSPVIDWLQPSEHLESVAGSINQEVEQVEKCDPWIKKQFGVEGVGEGLVFYPTDDRHQTFKAFGDLAFKAKGEKHQVIKQKTPVQVDPEKASGIDQFVDMVVTPARLEQGLAIACSGDFDLKALGPFLGWVGKDVEKETKAELEASGLAWKDVQKAVSTRARDWFLAGNRKS